jgi:hypothetical protein
VKKQEENRPGAPSSYTPEIAEEITERMIEGESVLKICQDDHMPSRVTVYRWIESNAAFRKRYNYAREAQAHYYADLIRDVAFDDSGDFFVEDGRTVTDHARVQRARLKVDTLKWLAARFNRAYSDKPPEITQEPQKIVISWLRHDDEPAEPPPAVRQEPRQITYQKTQLPADLSERDWSVMLEVLELVKRTIPTNGDKPPEEIFGVLKKALMAHFAELGITDVILFP